MPETAGQKKKLSDYRDAAGNHLGAVGFGVEIDSIVQAGDYDELICFVDGFTLIRALRRCHASRLIKRSKTHPDEICSNETDPCLSTTRGWWVG